MTTSVIILEGRAPIVVLRAFVAGLLFVVVFEIVADDERNPHTDPAPPPVSAAMRPMPVASGAILPEDTGWRL
jgi:hypothetical protein